MSEVLGDPHEAAVQSRTYFVAVLINSLSYGVYVALSLTAIQLQLQRQSPQKVMLIYSLVMFFVTTAWYILNMKTWEILIIEMVYYSDYYQHSLHCSGVNIASTVFASAQFIGSNILLLYRTYILWGHSILAVSIPLLTWLAYVGISIVVNLSCTPAARQIEGVSFIVMAYYIFPICTNGLCTLLLVGKLLAHRRMIRKHDMHSNANYGFVVTVIAESGLFYAATGIAHVILGVRGSTLINVSHAVFIAAAQLTEAHIILRITLGVEARVSREAQTGGSALFFGTRSGEASSHAMGHMAHVDINTSPGGLETWKRSDRDNVLLPAVGGKLDCVQSVERTGTDEQSR